MDGMGLLWLDGMGLLWLDGMGLLWLHGMGSAFALDGADQIFALIFHEIANENCCFLM